MNEGDQAVHLIYLVGCLVLIASALLVRRIPIAQGLKMFVAWVLIFASAFIVFTMKDDFLALWDRVVLETRGGIVQEQAGEELRVRQASDGHFWVNAEVNGERVRFLVDSGATTTSLSAEVAARTNVRMSGGMPAMVRTANGIVAVQRGRADTIRVGTIERKDVAVHVSESFGDMNVIGMNFLSSLRSWRVEGRTLVLQP